MTNNSLRIITGVIGAPLVLGLTYLGGWSFAVILAVAAIAAQYELYRLMELGGLRPQKVTGMVVGAFVALSPLLPWMLPLALIAILVIIGASPFRLKDKEPLHNLSATVFGVIYPTALLAFLLELRLARGVFVGDLEAFYLTMGVFLLIWATDTFAYFVGRSIGKHRLAPSVSPKKTWEGSAGGVLGAFIVAFVLKLTILPFLGWIDAIVLAVICGIVSQIGDLAESRLKRVVGAKDSGNVLPGHGGLLDRLDAMILSAPLVYLYLNYVARLFE